MKQKLLQKTLLLLFALIAGSTSVWADSSILTPTSTNIAPSDDHFTVTYGGAGSSTTWNNSSSCLRLYAKNTITFTSKNGELITQITFTGTVNANNKGKYPDTMSAEPGTISPATISETGETDFSWTYSTGTTSVTITLGGTAGNIDLTGGSFVVTYTPVEKTDPTITFNNGSVRVGKTLDVSTLFTSNSTGAVTYSITAGDSYASIDGSTLTGTAAGSVTVQASQAAAGAFNAKTATATITVTDPALTSIAITTPPTKTEYDEGDLFDATGMVVTATFADASIEDVTALCTWTPNGALATSDDEVTISYTYNAVTKTATQAITVNEYEQPLSTTIDLTQTFWGQTSGHTSGTAASDLEFSGTQDHVTIKYIVPKGSYYYYNTSNTRPYDTCTLQFDAPSGYIITSITFTSDGSNWNDATPTNGAMNSTNNKKWEGQASSVSFKWATSGTRIKTVVVTLSPTVSVTITDAGWASFSCACALNFEGTDVTAYIAKEKDASNVTLTSINKVPASTGIVVNAPAGTYNIPVLTVEADETTGNLLKPWLTAGTPSDATYYTLAVSGTDPIFKKSSGGTLAAGKSYLVLSGSGARELGVDFGDETAINALENSNKVNDGAIYDLSGRRVENPTKGIYIINGKKVVIR